MTMNLRKLLIILIPVIVFFVFVFPLSVFAVYLMIQPTVPEYTPPSKDEVLKLINEERNKIGVAPLVIDQRLDATSQMKTNDMVSKNYLGHYNPSTGEFVGNIHKSNPGLCKTAGENWSRPGNTGDANQNAVNWWMSSPPHREALLSAKYNLTGIGISFDKANNWYVVVQQFCEQ